MMCRLVIPLEETEEGILIDSLIIEGCEKDLTLPTVAQILRVAAEILVKHNEPSDDGPKPKLTRVK